MGFVGGSYPSEGVYINAKNYLISTNDVLPLSIAIGFQNLTSSSNTSLYLVASKQFKHEISGHFGFNAQFQNAGVLPLVMMGAEYYVVDQLLLIADVIGERESLRLNAGFRYITNDRFAVNLSVINATNSQNHGIGVSVGLSLTQFI